MGSKLNEAIALHQAGDFISAEKKYREILNQFENKDCCYLLGLLYSQIKQYTLAINYLEKSIPPNNRDGNAYNALAICYQKTGNEKTALLLINIAISQDPKNPNYCNRKSKIMISNNDFANAKKNALACIDKFSDFSPAYQTCFSIYNTLSRPDIALRIIKRASKLFSENPAIFFSLAEAYLNIAYYEKSKKMFQILIQHQYKSLECLNNLGIIEKDSGNLKESEKYFQQATTIDPKNEAIKWNIGLLHLLKGENAIGWTYYDARLSLWGKSKQLNNTPTWNGESLKNKSILIMAEQGIGDQVLFSTTYNTIISQAKKTTIECNDRLKKIFRYSFPNAIITTKINITSDYDFKIFSGSIFQHLKKTSITSPLLKTSAKIHFKSNNGKINIGFSWMGATNFKEIKKRSTHIRDWLSILTNKNVNFYCLQHNLSHRDKKKLSDLSENIFFPEIDSNKDSIDSLTAIISQLDLVISVTNTNIHLAGALGIKTWCITPSAPDWPWGIKTSTCQWYKSVELFRQEGNDWKSVLSNIEIRLKELI